MKLSEMKVKKVEKLHPPIAPKTIRKRDLKPPKPPLKKAPQEAFFIDFNKIANNSSFQRFIVEAIKMCVPQLKSISARTSGEVMSKAFNERITEIDKAVNVYDEIKEIGRGTHQDFRDVVKELKEKLEERKTKIQE